MPDCDKALELISAHIDGALTDEEEAHLTQHLNTCPACRSLLADLEQIHADMMDLAAAPAQPPAGLHKDIMARIQAGDHSAPAAPVKKRPSPWRTWGAMAAVFAVVILGAGSLYGSGFFNNFTISNGTTAVAAATPPQETSAVSVQDAAPAASDAGGTSEQPAADTPDSGAASNDEASQSSTAGGESNDLPSAKDNRAAGSAGTGTRTAPSPEQPPASTPVSTPAVRAAEPSENAQPQPFEITPSSTGEMEQTDDTPSSTVYCGILTISWEQAQSLSLLDELTYTAQGDTRCYTLSAECFADVVEILSAGGTQALTEHGEQIASDAQQGLIIVTGVPETQTPTPSPS